MLISTISCALLLASSVSAHSWVWCTDYQVENPGGESLGRDETDRARLVYDASLCSGYPPNVPTFFNQLDSATFGQDSGAETRPRLRDEFCIANGNNYAPNFPMASYTAGQIVTIAYPAKNHVSTNDGNLFLPDRGVNMYMAPLGSRVENNGFPSADAFLVDGELLPNTNGIHVDGQEDFLGFQRCPAFGRPEEDRATCTMDFTVPANLEAGEYYFGWHWEFNGGEHYVTCFSAVVAAADGATVTTTAATTTAAITTTQTQPTTPVETVAGVECDINGQAACTKGLNPPRGTCVVTDANDVANGFVCVCEEGFVNTADPQTCLLENGVRIQIVLNVEFDMIDVGPLFGIALGQDLEERFDISADRLSFTFSEGEGIDDGLVVVIITVSGAFDEQDVTAQAFFDELVEADSHDLGYMSNPLSVTCLDCGEDGLVAVTDASAALAPSLALIVAASLSSLMQ